MKSRFCVLICLCLIVSMAAPITVGASDSLNEAKFSNTAVLLETKPEMFAKSFDASPSSGMNSYNFSFFVDAPLTIKDIYFGLEADYQVSGLKIEIRKYAISNNKLVYSPSVAVIPAAVYNNPSDSPFIYNSWAQLVGGSCNVALERGVYQARILPLDKLEELCTEYQAYQSKTFFSYNVSQVYGFGFTGTGTKAGVVEYIVAIDKLTRGMAAGKTLDQIVKDVDTTTNVMIDEIEKAKAEKKKAEEEAARKAAAARAAQPIKLVVDGNVVKTDSPPLIENGRVLVPVRALTEALGKVVSWDSATQIINIYEPVPEELIIHMTVGSKKAKVATSIMGVMDEAILDVAPKLVSGRVLVPARFIAESIGCSVTWDANNRTVIVKSARG